jgi:gliding motility-associated-like protein
MTQVNEKCNGGTTATGTATPNGGTSPYTYTWTPSGGTNQTATGLSAGTYTVSVTDASPCTVTASITITQPPAITTSMATTLANCGSSNGSATVTPGGGGVSPYTYVWNPTGQTTQAATGLSAGSYTVTITDANGCTVTAAAVVGNIGGATTTIPGIINVSCYGGSNGSLNSNTVGGTSPYTYNWSPSGGTNAAATGLTAGSYTIAVTDAGGCISTATATITQPAQLRDSITNTVNELCYGGNNGSITVGVKGGTGAYTYSWTPGGGTNVTATSLTAGGYTVTVTDANGCTATATGTLTQPTAITLAAAGFPATCYNSPNGQATVIPSGGAGGYGYLWTPSGNTTANANNLTAGSYTVHVTDANGCFHDTTVVVTSPPQLRDSITATVNVLCHGSNNGSLTVGSKGGTGAYTYNWTNGQTAATATNLTAGSYTVHITDANGCSDSAVGAITEPTALTLTTTTKHICIGQSATLTPGYGGGTPAYTYNWTPNTNLSCNTCANPIASPTVTTVYSVTVTDANGCIIGPVKDSVIVNPPLTVAATKPATLCPGSSAPLNAVANGGDGNYTYTWSPAAGLSCTGCTNPTATPTVTTTYTVVVNDACGSPVAKDSITITVNPLPVVNFSADTLQGCVPICVNFTDLSTISSGSITGWNWNFGDGGTSISQNPHHCYNNPGTYDVTLTVTSNGGCTTTLTIKKMINVYSYPVANFVLGPQPATVLDPTIIFTDKSTDAYGIASWLWTFGDPLDVPSVQQNPTYKYPDTGTYCATLRVTNIHGCMDSITECLVISPVFTLYIPDAFSPNADGKNDIFLAQGTFVHNFKMYIFDRWGMLLFTSDDIYKGWPGTVHNGTKLCQEDTYVYLITCQDNFDNNHSYIGKVTLLR